jgi:hypothetical protein
LKSLPAPRTAALAFGALKLLIHLATLTPYGYFRDELYYIRCSEALAWGYVDQPPFCVAFLRAWRAVFGDSLAALRLAPALVGAATVVFTGLLAARMGGGVLAVGIASLAVLSAGQYLGTAHYYSMNVFDQLFWTVAAYALFQAVSLRSAAEGGGRQPEGPLNKKTLKPWIVLGTILGFALLNKISVLWLGAGIAVGLLATPARTTFKTPGPWVAGAIALAIFAPFVAWQAKHGWPMAEFMHNAVAHKYVAHSLGSFVKEQILQNNPFALPIWLGGLVALAIPALRARTPLNPESLLVGCIYVVAFVIIALEKTAKAEYLSPAYPMVMAVGGVFWEAMVEKGRAWRRWAVGGALAIVLGGGVLVAPFALACLSEDGFIAYQAALGVKPQSTERRELSGLTQFYADMHGWKELTDAVAAIYDSLPAEERAHVTIWTRSGGYGPAAAIDFFGRSRGLPRAISGHNNYWLWGPGNGDGRVAIVVGGGSKWLSTQFESFERVTTFECTYCRPDENHKPIYVGRNLKTPLSELWPEERNYE